MIDFSKRKNCDNCGAPLPLRYGHTTCPYCGTSYRVNGVGEVVYLEKRSGVTPLKQITRVSMDVAECMGGIGTIANRIREEMAMNMAKKILDYMDFQIEENQMENEYKLIGSVRVLDKQFEF